MWCRTSRPAWRQLRPISPGRPAPRDRSTPTDRRAVWASGEAVGDALSRWFNLEVTGGPGLYGGTYQVSGGLFNLRPLRLTFSNTRFSSDFAVSGSAVLEPQDWRNRR